MQTKTMVMIAFLLVVVFSATMARNNYQQIKEDETFLDEKLFSLRDPLDVMIHRRQLDPPPKVPVDPNTADPGPSWPGSGRK
jgi:hypothetical protein